MKILTVEEDQKHNNTREMYLKINQFKKGYQHKIMCFYLFIFVFYLFNKNITLK